MDYISKLKTEQFPKQLLEIPQPPQSLYVMGNPPPKEGIYLAVVGSRKHTSYGKEVCEKLIRGLKGYNIIIVSGLALGIDSIAHKTALQVGLKTVSFPGSGLNDKVLYPRTNLRLAKEIVKSGGCLISEFEPDFRATMYSFPQRNRLMAGISKAVLIIEAEEKSGTLITARMALDYNRDILAVPGPISSSNSRGTNWLIKQGATPIVESVDILEALGFDVDISKQDTKDKYLECSKEELKVINLLREPIGRDELIRLLEMDIQKANALLSIMEIKELIKEDLGQLRIN